VIRDDRTSREWIRPTDRLDPTAGPGAERQTILLVQDTEADRDVYGGLLWYNGYDVVHVSDGPTAIERAMEIRPDLILLDIILAGSMDGLEVARTLRDRGLRMPIVALSAHSPDKFGERVAAADLDAYLEKPVDPFTVVKEAIRLIGLARPSGLDT
jgi:CheY-like chemotaxis protein